MTPVYSPPSSLSPLHTPTHPHTHTATAGDYAEVRESGTSPVLGKAFSQHDVQLLDKIGEGQFGDVRKGLIYPDVRLSVCAPSQSICPAYIHVLCCLTCHVLGLL